MAYLALVRHGESEWNKKGLWTGWTDVDLTENGRVEAQEAGEQLKDYQFNVAYVSKLKRAQQTLDEIKEVIAQDIPTEESAALNERDYGIYTGKNKLEVEREVGEDAYLAIRRGWDADIPEGENLKQVFDRVLPYYEKEILPHLKEGENVLVSAHGNSLRALVKFLDRISDVDVEKLNIATGEVYLYEVDRNGEVVAKEILAHHKNAV